MRLTTRLTLTAFGLVSVFATAAVWAQLPGLYGSDGIVPIAETMEGVVRANARPWQVPTLLWLGWSDLALHLLLGACVLASVCVTAGVAPRWALLALYVCWLSIVQVGAPFLNFQWDVMLLETSLVFACLAPNGLRPFRAHELPEPSRAVRFAVAVLACKVTLGSGLVKLASGDESWRDLTALTWHWWTQPLPTWTSVLANEWPLWVQQALCFVMFVLELPVPLLAFGPRRVRLVGAIGLMTMQAGLLAAGNYSFYNALTLVTALPLLDDAALAKLWKGTATLVEPRRSPVWAWGLAAAFAFLSVTAFSRRFVFEPPLAAVRERLEPFHAVNAYGAFAVMTKTRPEIIVEGSDDGVTWKAWEFPWKPGRLDRRPDFVAPWQPRLDWQMWFAALGTCEQNPWFLSFQLQLLKGSRDVQALLASHPFGAPPKYLRATVWEYRFAPLAERGVWWTRALTGPYCPPLALAPNGLLRRAEEVEAR
ncbi:MAG: lipase maturation factor family protein [Myxococcaceae bacterium]|nr:lipase maturation factor family protein [Myxococcaceae bacterium]